MAGMRWRSAGQLGLWMCWEDLRKESPGESEDF